MSINWIQEIWKKISEGSKWCFSHCFTVPEETESKLPLLATLAITMASPRKCFFPPFPEEDWNEHHEKGNIGEEMRYLHIRPKRAWEERMTLH
jgi:hypothetical protein